MIIRQNIFKKREHKTGINDLLFFQDELKAMKRRLSEIGDKSESNEVKAQVEYFIGQTIFQQCSIDDLKHSISCGNDRIPAETKWNERAISSVGEKNVRDKIECFTQAYENNKSELNSFLNKYM